MKNSYSKFTRTLAVAGMLLATSWSVGNAQVLFDNGPYFNGAGNGFGGANTSMLYTTTFAMGTIGFGHQSNLFNRVADDFTFADCAWRIDSIVFFSYQTGSTTTSTTTGVNFRIWDSIPDAVGSNVVYGDTTTNRMIRTTWTGAYRVTETTLSGSTRPIMRNVCTAGGVVLSGGTFWIDWASTGSLSSGPWAPPRTPVGQSVTGNGRQRIGSVWNNALDGGTGTPAQGFPFIIYGTILNASANAGSDVSFCSGASVVIGGSPAGSGTGPVVYSWSPSGNLSSTTVGNPTANPASSAQYILTVTDSIGCVDLDTIALTVNQPTTSSVSVTVCDSYTTPSGNVLVSTGSYLDTIPNFIGCDSIISISLVVNQTNLTSINPVACGSYISPAGNTYTASATFNDTLTNLYGCDSIVNVTLTINNATAASISETACDMYMAPSGAMYTASGTYQDTIANAAGCDSVITIQLVINTVNTGVTQSGVQLSSDANGATYQWIYCDSAFAPIPGATSQTYFPTSDGNYAVIVTENSCTDTSACILVLGTSVVGSEFGAMVNVYPNPTAGNTTLDLGRNYTDVTVVVTDVNGRAVWSVSAHNLNQVSMELNQPAGVYFISIQADNNMIMKSLIKQ